MARNRSQDPKRARQQLELAERKKRAIELRVAGFTASDVGRTLGVSGETVRRWFAEHIGEQISPDAVEELRARELERLDRAVIAIWPQVMHGDTKAVDTFVRVSGRVAALCGLDAPKQVDVGDSSGVIQTLADLARAAWQHHEDAERRGLPVVYDDDVDDAEVVDDGGHSVGRAGDEGTGGNDHPNGTGQNGSARPRG